MNTLTFDRFYRYDFAVTKIFNEMLSKYYGIVVSGHILSYSPRSVVQILNETNKPFFVDPMTFVFARDIDIISRKGKIRRSYQKMMDNYGSPFSDCISGNPLSPSTFKNSDGSLNDTLIRHITKNVIQCQEDKLVISEDLKRYDRLLKKGIPPTPVSPSFLVPPYFYANMYDNDWYNISLRFAELSRDLFSDKVIMPVLCFSRDLLWDDEIIKNIVHDYQGFDGYIIWINQLKEKYIREFELSRIKNLISQLATNGKPVYSLYGGFLCDLLGKFGLAGYSSGICYGESRSVDTRGGGAGNRYYVVNAHLKISEGLANAFFERSDYNKSLICSCPTCSEIIDTMPSTLRRREFVDLFFSQMDFMNFRRHFVNVKFQEANMLQNLSIDSIKQYLENDIKALSKTDSFDGQPDDLEPIHIKTWSQLFF